MIVEEAIWVARCDSCGANIWRADSRHAAVIGAQSYAGALVGQTGSVLCQKCRPDRAEQWGGGDG